MKRTLLLALALAASQALAQTYPTRPIRVIVAFPPGGAIDLTARMITPRLSAALGQPLVIENRVGAGGAIAEDAVTKAPADGYTILYTPGSDMTARRFLTRKPALDPLKDFTPLATAVMSVNIIAAGAGFPHNTFAELVAAARRAPGKITFSSAGVTSYHHLIGELLKQNGVDMVHVPYKGAGPALTALLGGQTDIAITNFGIVRPQVREGKVKPLAVVEAERYQGTPDIPSIRETLNGFKAPPSWFGFFAPPGLPAPIAERLSKEIKDALETAEVAERIRGATLNVFITPLDRMPALILETTETFGTIVKTAGIEPTE